MIKFLTFTLLYKYIIFSFSWLILISLFAQIMWNIFLSTVNKRTIAIMIIIIMINILKVFWKNIFVGFQLKAFENKGTFLFCMKQLWCTAKLDKFHLIYLLVTTVISQIWHLCHELLKSTRKVWKPEGINDIVMKDLNLWQILAAWTY